MEAAAHTLSRNFLGITRRYAEDVFLPTFEQAACAHEPIEVTLLLAGKRLRLVFHVPVFAERMLPAFAHLEEINGTPDLTIHMWDSVGSGIELMQPYHKHEHMNDFNEGTQIALDAGFYGVYFSGEESIQVYDSESGQAYFWTYDARALPGWVIAAPLRAILHWYLASIDIQLVHGAVVGVGNNAVLLTAKSGSGKSTTALACVLDGMAYLGDDYVAVAAREELCAYTVYNSAKCTAATLDALPAFRPYVHEVPSVDERKSVIYLHQVFSERVLREARVRAIFVPVIGGGHANVEPVSKAGALLAMAPTAIFQLPYTSSKLIMQLRQIVESVPCHMLKLGNDIPATPQTIRRFLEIQ